MRPANAAYPESGGSSGEALPTPWLHIKDRKGLHDALQTALALELATIPPYLYALFSLRPGRNHQVAAIIRGVVHQEMLHVALVANILNALGAVPKIASPDTVPGYPGRLPGGIQPDLVVSLRRCSVEHVRDVFLPIEQPNVPQDQPSRQALAQLETYNVTLNENGEIQGASDEILDAPRDFFREAVYDDRTVGRFYQQIASAIIDLDSRENLFTGDPARQVTWHGAPGRLYRVTDARTALWAVLEIIHQGEGTPTDPTTGPLPGPAGRSADLEATR